MPNFTENLLNIELETDLLTNLNPTALTFSSVATSSVPAASFIMPVSAPDFKVSRIDEDGTPGDDDPFDGTEDDDTLDGLGGNDVINGFGGNDTLIGGDGNDTLNGGDGNDEIFGDLGSDLLFGGAGDDILEGGGGASDALDGGDGIDTASFENSGNRVIVNFSDGTASSGQATGDTLVNIENITGSAFGDVLTGDSGDNILSGGAGNDALNGGRVRIR